MSRNGQTQADRKKGNGVRLYNVIFPVWFLLLFPIAWLYALPANFILDSIVLLLALKILKVEEAGTIYKKTILGVWAFGFIADILGSVFLLISQLDLGQWWQEQVTMPVILNPWQTIPAFLLVMIALAMAAYLIYILNDKFLFSKFTQLGYKAKRICLILAICTAPYLFLVPTDFFYHGWDWNRTQGEQAESPNEVVDPEAEHDWVVADLIASGEKQLIYTDQNGNYYLYGADKDKTLLQTTDGEKVYSLQEALNQGLITIGELLELGFDIKIQVTQ